MNKTIKYMLCFLILTGYLAYIYGVFKACVVSWPADSTDYKMAAFLSFAVTGIAGVLSTNLGAVLGLTVTNKNSRFNNRDAFLLKKLLTDPTAAQILACYLFILSLAAAAVVWGHRDFTEDPDKIVPLIPQMTKTLLGVIVGAVAVSLKKEP